MKFRCIKSKINIPILQFSLYHYKSGNLTDFPCEFILTLLLFPPFCQKEEIKIRQKKKIRQIVLQDLMTVAISFNG